MYGRPVAVGDLWFCKNYSVMGALLLQNHDTGPQRKESNVVHPAVFLLTGLAGAVTGLLTGLAGGLTGALTGRVIQRGRTPARMPRRAASAAPAHRGQQRQQQAAAAGQVSAACLPGNCLLSAARNPLASCAEAAPHERWHTAALSQQHSASSAQTAAPSTPPALTSRSQVSSRPSRTTISPLMTLRST